MLAGHIDSTHLAEPLHRERTSTKAGPIVGASGADASTNNTKGVTVELSSTAVSLAAAISASGEPRSNQKPREAATIPSEVSAPTPKSAATNIALSSEAVRLALIPAQTIDQEALKALQAEREEAKAILERALKVSEASSSTFQLPSSQVAAPDELASISLTSPADTHLAQSSPTPKQASLRNPPPPGPADTNQTASNDDTMTGATTPAEIRSPVSAQSPFQSSTPGKTGQSLDIVAGESRRPASSRESVQPGV